MLGAGTADESANAARRYHLFLAQHKLKDSDVVEVAGADERQHSRNGNGKTAHRPAPSVRRPNVQAEPDFGGMLRRAATVALIELERDLVRFARAEGLIA